MDAAHEPTLPSADPESAERARAKAGGGRAPDAPLLTLGTVLAGTYELDGRLGSGAMGQVFGAHDLRLDRRVAVKAARAYAADLLRAEGRMLAHFDDPSIVHVIHAGSQGGVEFLVLERIAGRSLRAHLKIRRQEGGVLSIDEVVGLLRAIARALDVVHRSGVAHGDLKPENVMLTPSGRLVLTDFGLALPESTPCTTHVFGSPSYMAPELATGLVAPGCWHLVDLYALGVVGYELLVGRRPFDRGPALDTLRAHVRDPVPDLREARPDVPPMLAHVVSALLAKDPRCRPPTARQVRSSLDLVPGSRGLARLVRRSA